MGKGVEEEGLRLFKKEISRKGFTLTDAISAVTVRKLKLKVFLSYDLRSFQGILKNMLGTGYWNLLGGEEKNRVLSLIGEFQPKES